MLHRQFYLTLIWALPFGFETSYAASADDNFYKGKTIRLIVAFSAARLTVNNWNRWNGWSDWNRFYSTELDR
jgi:hypothetical protein